jgi:hybrid cluster-associated redox disulfide protein
VLAQRLPVQIRYTCNMGRSALAEILEFPIAVILKMYPETSRVFIANRMGCVGCAFSKFHTLRDVFRIYRLDEEVFLREMMGLMVPKDDLNPSKVRPRGPAQG